MPKPKMGYDSLGLRKRLFYPILPRYRQKRGLLNVDKVIMPVAVHIAASNDGRLIYVNNAKTACTTMTAAVYHYTFGRPAEKGKLRNDPAFRYGIKHWQENLTSLQAGDAFVFTGARDPAKRALSGFRNFFIDQNNIFASGQVRAIRKFGFSEELDISQKFDVFLDYIERSISLNYLRTDQHFRRQVDNVAFGQISYDFIVKVESIYEDLAKIPELAGIDDPHGAFTRRMHRNKSKPLDFSLNSEQRARIYALYKPDYEAFGYDYTPG